METATQKQAFVTPLNFWNFAIGPKVSDDPKLSKYILAPLFNFGKNVQG